MIVNLLLPSPAHPAGTFSRLSPAHRPQPAFIGMCVLRKVSTPNPESSLKMENWYKIFLKIPFGHQDHMVSFCLLWRTPC